LVPLSFIAGVVFALAALILLLPWLRTIPGLASLPALPWQSGIGALAAVGAVAVLSHVWTSADHALAVNGAAPDSPPAAVSAGATDKAWGELAQGLGALSSTPGARAGSGAQSMDSAIAALQSRLATSGGSNDDWELLAKSYEFEGRPDAAVKARAHQIPTPAASAGTASVVNGEVTLSAALRSKAPPGATLFVIAKSVASPGAPVAVLRTSVGSWPQNFSLDDSQSMLPAHNLSGAGPVTIEARVSQSGQALAATGDLQGSSAVIDPRDHRPVKITIDRVVP